MDVRHKVLIASPLHLTAGARGRATLRLCRALLRTRVTTRRALRWEASHQKSSTRWSLAKVTAYTVATRGMSLLWWVW